MNLFLISILNILFIVIAYIILSKRIKESSVPALTERYTKEVERLIVELNSALEDVLGISEERIDELKRLIKKAEKINDKAGKKISNKKVKQNKVEPKAKKSQSDNNSNLLEKARHLMSMGYSTDEIAKVLNIQKAEVEFLESLSMNKG